VTARRRALAVSLSLAAAAAVAVAAPASAPAASDQETQFQDDTLLVFRTPSQVAQTLDTLRGLGVDRIRVSMYWSIIAPSPTAATKPSFDAADPSSYPQDGWRRYDLIDQLAAERGIAVNWNLVPPTPAWASAKTSDANFTGHYNPDPQEYGQWAQAVGRRYSGSYVPPPDASAGSGGSGSGSGGGGGGPVPPIQPPVIGTAAQARVAADDPVARAAASGGALPRVSFYSIWNEPNEYHFLAPQWGFAGSRVIEAAGAIYRSLVDAGYAGLAASGHGGDTILIGETAPKGKSYPGPTNSIKPLRFLRAVYCVGPSLRPLTGEVARALGCPTADQVRTFPAQHPALFRASGWGHHPYSLVTPPGLRSPDRDDVGFADLARLTTSLRTVFSRYGIRRAGLPIYLTEFGYQSRPPDPFGFPPGVQAAFLNQSEYQAYRNRQIRAYSQFLLVDDQPLTQYPRNSTLYWSTFQTGIVALNGTPKPSYYAFRLPIYLPVARRRSAGPLRVWGDLRPAPNGTRQTATVQFRPRGRGARWRAVARLSTVNPRNYIDGRVRFTRSGTVRLAWVNAAGGTLYSREVGVSIG
jgi:hypothetical protein